MDHSVRPLPQFSRCLVFLCEKLGVLEIGFHIFSFETDAVGGVRLGKAVHLHAEFLLDHGFIFPDECKIFEGGFDMGDALGAGLLWKRCGLCRILPHCQLFKYIVQVIKDKQINYGSIIILKPDFC